MLQLILHLSSHFSTKTDKSQAKQGSLFVIIVAVELIELEHAVLLERDGLISKLNHAVLDTEHDALVQFLEDLLCNHPSSL